MRKTGVFANDIVVERIDADVEVEHTKRYETASGENKYIYIYKKFQGR
jgi:hypothetical protein